MMNKMLKLLLVLFMIFCQFDLQTLTVDASETAINDSAKKPKSGTYYYVDYYDGKKEKNPVDLVLFYESKGRIFDDGLAYHFYDGNDHEINLAYPGYVYPSFELLHAYHTPYYSGEYEYDIVYNSFGSPASITAQYYSMTFSYFDNGNIKSIVYRDSGREYVTTFEYSGNRITKMVSKASSSDTYWQRLEQFYNYSGDNLAYIDGNLYAKGYSGVYTNGREVYEYNSRNQIVSIKDVNVHDPAYLSDARTYHYDSNGILTDMDVYQMGEGETGYRVYYSNHGGKPPKPHNNDAVKLTGSVPETDTWNDTFISSLTLTFNYDIASVNFGKGNIYIYDKETGQEVYRMPAELNAATFIRAYQNKLTWRFPGVSSKKALVPGHTYYLKMDPAFLTFKGTDKTISLGDSKDAPEWEFRVTSEEDDIITGNFDFKRTEPDKGQSKTGNAEFVYNKAFFYSNSSTYNSSLARLSMDVAIAAYNSSDRSNGSEHVTELFKKMKFDNTWHNADYDGPTGDHTTGVFIASKKLTPTRTLIAIAIRGGGYGNEWAGNFVLGNNSVDHEGFSNGRKKAIDGLKEFISANNITGNVVFWVTGYSRASAIANLTAAYLDDGFSYNGISYGKGDVYAYCFEVPACTTSKNAGSAKYSNIFSIVNPYDIVCRLPLLKWGFTRYGNVMILPYQYCGSYYNDYRATVLSRFNELSGHSASSLPELAMIEDINTVMKLAGRYITDRSLYYSKAQEGLAPLARKAMGGGEVSDAERPAIDLMAAFLLKEVGEDLAKDVGMTVIYDKVAKMFPFAAPLATVLKIMRIYNAGNTVKTGIDAYNYYTEGDLLLPHFAELTLAWMEILEGTGVLDKYEETSSTSEDTRYASIFVRVHCPVDVQVYEQGTDKLLAQIIGDKPENMEDSPVICWTEESDTKCFVIPTQYDAYFVITPTDNGTMTVNITGKDMLEGTVIKEISFENVELTKGEAYKLDVVGGFDGSDFESDLYDAEEEWIEPDLELMEDEIEYCDVEVLTEGYGTAMPAIDVIKGETAILHAEPYEKNKFLGWYDSNGEKVSDEQNLVVTVNENMTFTAKFTEKDPTKSSLIPFIAGGLGALGLGIAVFIFLKKKKK